MFPGVNTLGRIWMPFTWQNIVRIDKWAALPEKSVWHHQPEDPPPLWKQNLNKRAACVGGDGGRVTRVLRW